MSRPHPDPAPPPLPDRPLGVYVHWPFCLSKCLYCDFASTARGRPQAAAVARVWTRALVADLAAQAARLGLTDALPDGRGRRLVSVFFGGGTPSLMEPETVAAVIAAARHLAPADPDLEITLEANPGTVDPARLAAFREAGVTRLSLGLQSLDDAALAGLGRRHDAAAGRAAWTAARRIFDRVSADVILGRPGQTRAGWRAELTHLVERLAPDHLSAYQLTVEDGTPLAARVAAGRVRLPDEDTQADLYTDTCALLARAGLERYEVSNFARPGAACRHNQLTWRGDDLLGVGPAAHGRLGRDCPADRRPDPAAVVCLATEGHRRPAVWLAALRKTGCGLDRATPVGAADRATELVLTGLRTVEGVQEESLRHRTGLGLGDILCPRGLAQAREAALVTQTPCGLRATDRGLLVLDHLLALILA